jgi:hypothetical protein
MVGYFAQKLDGDPGSEPICPSRITSGRVAIMYSMLSRGQACAALAAMFVARAIVSNSSR